MIALAAIFVLSSNSAVFADRASDVTALEAKCKADPSNDPGYCERFWKGYGNARRGANGGTIPRMFGDLPI